LRVPRQHGFQVQLTFPMINEGVNVAETLPSMEAQRHERQVARINIDVRATQLWTSIRFAIDVKRVNTSVARGEDELQRRMAGGPI
jgi:hypothetical protein